MRSSKAKRPHDHSGPARVPGSRVFQERVHDWILTCFGVEAAENRKSRSHRFLEEAIELAQATGCTPREAHELVDYVFGRPIGEHAQEVGGVMITLAALCNAFGLELEKCAQDELASVWQRIEKIRAKQAQKPKFSPLPELAPEA